MQIFTKNGHFVKKIAIRYIDIVAGLAITSQGKLQNTADILIDDEYSCKNWLLI